MKRNILGIVNLGKLQLKKQFFAKCMEIVLNKSTEVEEEEYAGGNKFPGSENCILSQALTLRDYRGLWCFCNVTYI